MPDESLLTVMVRRLSLTPEAAQRRLFRVAFSGWRLPAMRLVSWVRPELFRIDHDVVTEVGRARSYAQAAHAVEVFRYRSKGQHSWIRNGLGVRASGRRLLEFAGEMFR